MELDAKAIRNILPHRYPFLLVDRIVEIEAGRRAVGIKNVTVNEPQFTGHWPENPVMPGVLMLEAMAQVGGTFLLTEVDSDGKQAFLVGLDGVRFRRQVVHVIGHEMGQGAVGMQDVAEPHALREAACPVVA